ncbi:multidrug resistance-associated protein 1-like [Arctopsyche grandis]|uniref:multidrug resistance-associated protein 1-like n=1 Tax=Arctopsyche grandis TaxID=121162 RepID=UPI00406D7F8E
MDHFCGSPFWDLNTTWNTNNPKFTPCFEKTVLVWIPCIFLWLFAPYEISRIFSSKTRNIPWSTSNIIKTIVNTLLILITCVDLIFYIYESSERSVPQVEIYTPTIKIITFILAMILLQHNKAYGLQSSGLLFLFWFSLSVCSIPRMLTGYMTKPINDTQHQLPYITFAIFFILTTCMLVCNCFADKPPRISLYIEQVRPCPEHGCSFLSQIFYTWFDPLIRTGFKRPLINTDLWSLNPEDRSAEAVSLFDYHWKKSLNALNKSSFAYTRIGDTNAKNHASIVPALCKSFGWSFCFAAILKLTVDILVFLSPLLLSKLISYINNEEHVWKGYLYAILLFLTAAIETILLSQYSQRVELIGMRVCTALTSAVYRKALKLSNSARRDSTIGEIVNLMSVDVQKFNHLMKYLNMLWSAPLQIMLSLYFLWKILGPSIFSGLIVIVILIPINAVLVRRWETIQTDQMESKDKRIKLINEILNGIKVLKLYAWEPSFEEQVNKIRNEEVTSLKKITYLNSVFSFIWLCCPFLVSMVTFATFVLSNPDNVLDSKAAFVSLSLLNILQFPLTIFPSVINYLIQVMVSVKRINKLMNADELEPSNVSHNFSEDYPITIEDGIFSWDTNQITLNDINLNVRSGSLVAVVGNVGSGKSSLLSALLGEMDKISGQVNTHGSIAYVPQQAWIQNETLQNNILFGNPMANEFYNSVINACALNPDLDMLPARDQTEIGEKGINLSGGQKQRVALAQAVYCDNDIYLLDDPLSAVDSHIGKHIFEQVIGPQGLLKHKTRILVTHAITYLPKVDNIIVLKDGNISEFGTYQELLEKGGLFAEFLLLHLSRVTKEEEPELIEIKKQLATNLGDDEFLNKLQRARSLSETISETSSDITKNKDVKEENDAKESVTNRIIEDEQAETGNIKWPVYYHYFKSVGPFLAIATIISNVAYQGFNIGGNFWLSNWSTNNDLNTNGTNDTHTRDLYLGVYGALGIGQVLSSFFYNLAPQLGFWLAAKIMHEEMLKNIMRSPLSFFDTTPTGRILSRFSKDVDVLDVTLPWNVSECIFCIFQVIGTLAVISLSTPIFITVIIPISVAYYFIQRYYIATSRQLKRLESVTRSPIYSHFAETISGASIIRAYDLQERFVLESEDKVDCNHTCSYATTIANSWLSVRLEMVGNLIILSSALFAVIIRDKISPGIVGLSVSYALQITQTLNWIVNMASEVETNIVAVERIKEYSENIQEAAWRKPDADPNQNWPLTGQLNIDELVIRYRSTTVPVLHKISCHIESGEKIGVVGRTGAGKSSLALAIFRILEADSGKISIDHINISNIGLHSLRSRLTIIPQDSVLFSGSLRFNLDPFGSYSDDELWNALEHAHLKAFVENLTTKLEHTIDEGGANLSSGQRQLVCLARALLRKSQLLILDEATAAVDLETDDLIQKTIRSEFSSCTILTIAHRINTIMDSNKILVLDKGKLVEFDTPANLLQDKNTIFYKLAKDAGVIK